MKRTQEVKKLQTLTKDRISSCKSSKFQNEKERLFSGLQKVSSRQGSIGIPGLVREGGYGVSVEQGFLGLGGVGFESSRAAHERMGSTRVWKALENQESGLDWRWDGVGSVRWRVESGGGVRRKINRNDSVDDSLEHGPKAKLAVVQL